MNVKDDRSKQFHKGNFLTKYISKNSLVSFFLISYILISLAVVLKLILNIHFIIYWILSAWSPTIAAIILSGIIGGSGEIKHVLKGFLKWKIHVIWYVAAFSLMFFPLIFAFIYLLLGGEAPGMDPSITLPALLLNLIFTLFSGPLSEEAGWRGFALPRLQKRFSALTSSIILGIVWACWHLPLYFVEERMPFYIFIALVVVISILMTWGYNNTRGSLIITVIFHFSFNFGGSFIAGYLGLLPPMIFYISGSIMIIPYVILVVVYSGPSKLSRKSNFEKLNKVLVYQHN